MQLNVRWMTILAALGLTWQCDPAGGAPAGMAAAPEIAVPACPAPPYLDGVLTDACWQSAAVITNLSILKTPDATAAHRVCLARDGQWLYLAVAVAHPVPRHIKQSVFEHDGSVQTDDAIEIFMDPGSAGKFYLHYCLNASNIKSDQLILSSGERDRQARMPWRSAARLTDAGWNAELAFPLKVMVRETRYRRRCCRNKLYCNILKHSCWICRP